MPRTFKALAKRYVDDSLIPAGKVFTTNAFDHDDAVVPKTLQEIGSEMPKMPEVLGAAIDDAVIDDGDKADIADVVSLSELTLPELKEIAKAERIDGVSRMPKDQLIMAIESMREANAKIGDSGTVEGSGLAVPIQSIKDAPIV